MTTGTENLLELANDLRSTAPNIRAWFDHTKAASLMERAAEVIEKFAALDPDINVQKGDN